jgi:predicted dehydrogenase
MGILGWSLKPKWVLAQTWKVAPQFSAHVAPGSDADSHYSAFIKCEDGTVITLERGEFTSLKSEYSWQIIGTDGSLRMNMLWQDDKEIYFDATDSQNGVVSKVIWKGTDKLEFTHDAPVMDFAQAILENRQPLTSLEQALVMQKITDAIYKSSEEGQCVEIII